MKDAVEATCTTDGYFGDVYCKDCGKKIQDGVVVPAGHKLRKVEKVPATENAEGHEAYYVCSGCGKLFSDEAATKEITLSDVVIKKLPKSSAKDVKETDKNASPKMGDSSRMML